MKYIECQHFKVIDKPYRSGGVMWDLGHARCEKLNLVVDFASNRYLKTLECVESEVKQNDPG